MQKDEYFIMTIIFPQKVSLYIADTDPVSLQNLEIIWTNLKEENSFISQQVLPFPNYSNALHNSQQ